MSRALFRITLVCEDVPKQLGAEAAHDITEAFFVNYLHEQNAKCSWDGEKLWLVAENDHDPEGLNLMDEFSDNLCAFLPPFDGELRIVAIDRLI